MKTVCALFGEKNSTVPLGFCEAICVEPMGIGTHLYMPSRDIAKLIL